MLFLPFIGSKKYHAVANIGYKPTFNGEKYLFEAHIFNFSGDLIWIKKVNLLD